MSASGTQNAVANGDNRSIALYHTHTKETTAVTFRRDGSYDREALRKLNWALRDWRRDEQTDMDPRLFDVIWQVMREVGSNEPLHVVSAYRSPQTNAALRRRSRGVAQQSQHMVGKAVDFYLPDADMGRVRAIAMRLQHGGVGFYPGAFNPFVHLDVGSVRSWPRMPRAQLARLFPDGKTVHLPADGKPLDGYELARAEILARGGAVSGLAYAEAGEGTRSSGGRSFWAALFGGADEDEDLAESGQTRGRATAGRRGSAPQVAAAYAPTVHTNDAGIYGFVNAESRAASAPAPAPVAAQRTQVAAAAPAAAPAAVVPATPAQPSPAQVAPSQTAPAAPSLAILPPTRPGQQPAAPQMTADTSSRLAPLPPVRQQQLALADVAARAAPLPPRRLPGTAEPAAGPGTAQPGIAALAMAYAPAPPIRAGLPVAAGTLQPLPAPFTRQPQAQTPVRIPADARKELQALFAAVVGDVAPRRAARVANARVRAEETPGTALAPATGMILATRFAPGTALPAASDRFSGPAVQPVPVTSLPRN